MLYECDPAKARSNARKHGIHFVAAIRALEDPRCIEEPDDGLDYGEERFRTIGMSAGGVLLVVNVLLDHDRIRIISARRATPYEEALYHHQR